MQTLFLNNAIFSSSNTYTHLNEFSNPNHFLEVLSMSFIPNGVDIELVRNITTGRFDFDFEQNGPNKGNPRFGNSRSHAVLSILVSKKRDPITGEGGYYFDRTGVRGTFLYKIKYDRLSTGSQLKSYADDGGQQLISRLFVSSFSSSPNKKPNGGWTLNVSWSTPTGNFQNVLTL